MVQGKGIAPALERHHGMCDWDHGRSVWGHNGSVDVRLIHEPSGRVLKKNTFISTFQSHVSVDCGTAAILQERHWWYEDELIGEVAVVLTDELSPRRLVLMPGS